MSERKKLVKIGQIQKSKNGNSYIKFGQGNKEGTYPSDNFVNRNLPLTLNPGDTMLFFKIDDEKRQEKNIPAFISHDVCIESRNDI